jgi:hypothetical protein
MRNYHAYGKARFYQEISKLTKLPGGLERLVNDVLETMQPGNPNRPGLFSDNTNAFTTKDEVRKAIRDKSPHLHTFRVWGEREQLAECDSEFQVYVPTALAMREVAFRESQFSAKGFDTLEEAESFASDLAATSRVAPPTGTPLTTRSRSMELGSAGASASPTPAPQAGGAPRILAYGDSQSSDRDDMEEDLDEEPRQPPTANKAQPKEAATPQATVPTISLVIAQQFCEEEMRRNIAPVTLETAFSVIQGAMYSSFEGRITTMTKELRAVKAASSANEKRAIEATQHTQSANNHVKSLEKQLFEASKSNKRADDGTSKSSASITTKPLSPWLMPLSNDVEAANTYCVALITFLPKEHAGPGNKTAMPINIDHTDSPQEQLKAAKAIICEGPHCLLQAHTAYYRPTAQQQQLRAHQ